uniref:Polysaccharide chain length determinant N-terminal domain-containing protein n=1 Tax=Desulfatirhabdium butyrativorans TaxID=340467 RepID=A0A7C4W0Q6_9BACT
MAETPQEQQIDLSFLYAKYIEPIIEKKMIVLICLTAGFLASMGLIGLINPEYVSQATILLERPRSKITSTVNQEDVIPQKASPAYVSTEEAKLQSDSFIAEVVKILPASVRKDLETPLNLKDQVIGGLFRGVKMIIGEKRLETVKRLIGKGGAPTVQDRQLDMMIRELKERVSVYSRPHTSMIWIFARAVVPENAAMIVKAYLEVWMALNLEENKREISGEHVFAEEQKNEGLRKLQEAENELIEFKRTYQIPADVRVTGDVELQLELDRLQKRVDTFRERYETLEKIYMGIVMKEAGISGNIKVLSYPAPSTEPSKKTTQKILIGGVLGGLGLGIGLCLLIDYLAAPIRHTRDILASTKFPVIGRIPRIS